MERQFDKPRFHQKTEVPSVPAGKILVKFHGQPALIPDKAGEPLVGNFSFTQRQLDALFELEFERRDLEKQDLESEPAA